jgi:hypothetical protein
VCSCSPRRGVACGPSPGRARISCALHLADHLSLPRPPPSPCPRAPLPGGRAGASVREPVQGPGVRGRHGSDHCRGGAGGGAQGGRAPADPAGPGGGRGACHPRRLHCRVPLLAPVAIGAVTAAIASRCGCSLLLLLAVLALLLSLSVLPLPLPLHMLMLLLPLLSLRPWPCCVLSPFPLPLGRAFVLKNQVSIVVAALPSMVVEVWSLYRATYELLSSPAMSASIAAETGGLPSRAAGRGTAGEACVSGRPVHVPAPCGLRASTCGVVALCAHAGVYVRAHPTLIPPPFRSRFLPSLAVPTASVAGGGALAPGAQAAAFRGDLDAALPVLREFFARVQRAAAAHKCVPCLPVCPCLACVYVRVVCEGRGGGPGEGRCHVGVTSSCAVRPFLRGRRTCVAQWLTCVRPVPTLAAVCFLGVRLCVAQS